MFVLYPSHNQPAASTNVNVGLELIQQSDDFVEALSLLNEDIKDKEEMLVGLKRVLQLFSQQTNDEPYSLLTALTFDGKQELDTKKIFGDATAAMSFVSNLIIAYQQALYFSKTLFKSIKLGFANGSVLTAYIYCDRMMRFAEHEISKTSTLINAMPRHIRQSSPRCMIAFKTMARVHRTELIRLIGDLLSKACTTEEKQIYSEIKIHYYDSANVAEHRFVYDSKLLAYFRNDSLASSEQLNEEQYNEQFKKIHKSIKRITDLLNVLNTGDLRAKFVSEMIGESLTTKYEQYEQELNQFDDSVLCSIISMLKIYAIKYELMFILETVSTGCIESYRRDDDTLSLLIDFDRLKISDAKRTELFSKYGFKNRRSYYKDIADSSSPHVSHPNISSLVESTASSLCSPDLTQSQSKPKKKSKHKLSVTDLPASSQSDTYGEVLSLEELSASNSVNKLTKSAAITHRKIALANIGNMDTVDMTDTCSDIKTIEVSDINKQQKLFMKLFDISTNSFTHSNAETIFSSLNGKIESNGGSHVRLKLPSATDNLSMRLIGASSFHGPAEKRSLELFRTALYRHMSPAAIEHLRSLLPDGMYEPGRRDISNSCRPSPY